MEELQKKIDAVMRLVTANTIDERNAALVEVRRLLESPATVPAMDTEGIVCDLLLELGAPDHLMGYPMVVEGVLLALEDRWYLDNVTYGLYPKQAECFDTVSMRVERAIRHLIEITWVRGDIDAQHRLFGNTVHPDKCKPTNGQFIARLVTLTHTRMKMA